MKIIDHHRKTKRQQIFDILDKQGTITDRQAKKVLGASYYNSYDYEMMWRRLRADEKFFKGKKIIKKVHENRKFLIKIKGENYYFRVGRLFFEKIDI